MIEYLFQVGMSNTIFALVLAILALLAGKAMKRHYLAHLLWVLVLIKLVSPPIYSVPISMSTNQMIDAANLKLEFSETSSSPQPAMLPSSTSDRLSTFYSLESKSYGWVQVRYSLAAIWLLGTLIATAMSLIRVVRFNQLLLTSCKTAGAEVQSEADRLLEKFGLSSSPELWVTSAQISPMVWWVGGKVKIVIPERLLQETTIDCWRWVLAHEIAHIYRRDYLVRWLEWFAVMCFWWNPIVWWAQRNLRVAEEVCTDSLVIATLKPLATEYANSVLSAVESFVSTNIRPPAMASEINSGDNLERRIEMIISNQRRQASRVSVVLVVSLATLVVPLSLAQAQKDQKQGYLKVEKRLQKFVDKDEITKQQFEEMMSVLTKRTSTKADPDFFKTLREFSGNALRVESAFTRRKNSMIELELFQQLANEGCSTLDVELDAQRRFAQAKIAFDCLVFENAEIRKLMKKHFSDAIAAKEITDAQYAEWTIDIDKTMSELRKKLGTELDPTVVRDKVWLARRKLETSIQARNSAVETWRTIKKGYEAGVGINVQQLAQASEQYYFFDAQVMDASHEFNKADSPESRVPRRNK